MAITGDSFWVRYSDHNQPTFLENAGNGQKWQRDTALKYVKSFRLCLDIGSNIGQWTRPLSKKFEKVICFEPNKNFIECFNKNITENNVVLYNYGLSDKEHTAKQEGSTTILKNEPGDVECKTLDSFNFTDVDLIKIDVDGFELQCVKGAVQTLTDNNPVLNIEMKWAKRPDVCNKVSKILKSIGYIRTNTVKSDEVWLKT